MNLKRYWNKLDKRSNFLSKIIELVVPSKIMKQQSYLWKRTINSLKELLSHSTGLTLKEPETIGDT
ncbi:25194_t:CDS:1, partial [Dentiscutata erythropus]